MSEFNGLWKCQNNPACIKSVSVFRMLKLDTTGQFSEADLLEWMHFVIFHTRSHERSQLPLPALFLSWHWFMLCITMEVEPRTAKRYECHYSCVCKNYRAGNGDADWGKKSVFASFPSWPEDQEFVEKMRFLAAYIMSNKFLLAARHTLTIGLQKCL